jgi:hypothetical protein
MKVFVECKADETLAVALGVPRRAVEHASGRGGVCSQLLKHEQVLALVDEDPDAQSSPYLKSLREENRSHDLTVLMDDKRGNRVVVISPRLEEWLVQTTRTAGLRLTDFGFDSDNGVRLHSEINQRLESLEKVLAQLLALKDKRTLRLSELLVR